MMLAAWQGREQEASELIQTIAQMATGRGSGRLAGLAACASASDTRMAIRSLQRLKLLRDSADATVWIAHDPQDWAQHPHQPYAYE